MMKEFLPIGTIIKIMDKEEKYVIIGKFIVDNTALYDYKCAIYPYGYITEEDCININNDSIDKIYYLGNVNY